MAAVLSRMAFDAVIIVSPVRPFVALRDFSVNKGIGKPPLTAGALQDRGARLSAAGKDHQTGVNQT
jgi:hypothetical protein